MINLELFSNRLCEYLKVNNMSQIQLANKVELTPPSITKYIKKQRTPRKNMLLKIAHALNVNPNYLSGESDNTKPPQDIETRYVKLCEKELMNEQNLPIFSKRLKLLIKQRDKKNKEIANELHIGEGVFSNYIHGRREPSFEILKLLCNYFNVTSDYLLGLSHDDNNNK